MNSPSQVKSLVAVTMRLVCVPHQKLLGDEFLTPVPLFCLISTIISNKTGIFD